MGRVGWSAVVLAALFGCGWAVAQPTAENRLALVIGNSSYKHAPLPNAVPDARLMEVVLKESGFEVIKAENASLREMRRLVRDFGDRLNRSGGTGLFYYAGHGVQVNGENFLVSVDSDIRREDEVADDSISAQLVLSKMDTARNRVNIIILDACRNNPFAARTRSVSNGLAIMTAPSGSLVAYSTAPGAVAEDGTGANSLYTKHLARVMRVAGLPVEEVFKRVRAAVRTESKNRQTPWENTALEGQFFFRDAPNVAPSANAAPAAPPAERPAADPQAAELAFWDAIKTSSQPADLEEFLKQFPQGRFAGLVKNRLAAIDVRGEPAPAGAAAPAMSAEAEAWDFATRADELGAYQRYLDSHPRGTHAVEAQGRLDQLQAVVFAGGGALRPGDRLAYMDFDAISGAPAGTFSRTVTRLAADVLEFDRGVLLLSRFGPGSVGSSSVAEILGAAPKQLGGFTTWTGEFRTAQNASPPVPLEFKFEQRESRNIGSKEWSLVRASVKGFAPNIVLPGNTASANAMIRGHALVEEETGVVVELHLRSAHPSYALRRELISVIRANP